jgi:hypothetical protein
VLVVACAVALIIRVAYVLVVPDFDGDAYAHYEFATRALATPGDLTVHWVWLPGFHFLVAALQKLGATFRDVRIFNAMLSAAGPFLLYRYVALRERDLATTALTAALLWAVSSLGNLLGTTALAEVSFTLLLLGACVAMDVNRSRRRHALVSGLLLTGACTMRYEAWFVVVALASWWVLTRVAIVRGRVSVPPAHLLVIGIPAVTVAIYVVARRIVDHEWLWFVRETYRFTHMQRGLVATSPVLQALWFPVILPAMLLGPAVVLLPFSDSASSRDRPSTIVPVALLTFLALSYLGRGALAQPRYFTALMPFACVLLARACVRVAARLRRTDVTVSWVVVGSVLFTTLTWGGVVARSALGRETDLRAREDRANERRARIAIDP